MDCLWFCLLVYCCFDVGLVGLGVGVGLLLSCLFAVGLGVLLCIDFWRPGWVAGVVDLVLGVLVVLISISDGFWG